MNRKIIEWSSRFMIFQPRGDQRRLARALEGADIPRHVGVIVDGNRRWARAIGLEDPNAGHRRGADKITDLLEWCDEAGVEVVTLFLLSTDNLSRPEPELVPLLRIIEAVAATVAVFLTPSPALADPPALNRDPCAVALLQAAHWPGSMETSSGTVRL